MPRSRPDPAPTAPPPTLRHRIEGAASAAVIGALKWLPYRLRVPAMGWFARVVLGPLALNRRVRSNLRHVFPDMPAAEVTRLCRAVADNFGRSFMELQSAPDFIREVEATPIHGPGLESLETARRDGRPVILQSAHFGNYDVWRVALKARGFRIGALYMPMTNPVTNRRYVENMAAIGDPLFPRGSAGMSDMIRFLRGGGMLGLLGDLYIPGGELMDFLGKPAWTATSAAKMALKYDALLVPLYATRNPDGLSFSIEIEAPIPHSDPLTMTKALTASTEARIRANPGQWFWLHRRWKNTADTSPRG